MPGFLANSINMFWHIGWQFAWRALFHFFRITGLWWIVWRPIYVFYAYLYKIGAVPTKFINYGYVPLSDNEKESIYDFPEEIQHEGMEDWTHIQLYEKLLSLCPEYPALEGLQVLEIGCGHGGGVEWIERAHPQVKGIRGMDMTIIDDQGGKIFYGDAQNIPLEDQCVDLIVNVESSHCYDDKHSFFKHSFRILRPGGYLLWADFTPYLDLYYSGPRDVGFEIVNHVDITKNVVKSLDIQYKRIQKMFQVKWYTRITSFVWNHFWAVPGTGVYRDLKAGRFMYTAICWKKPGTLCKPKSSNSRKSFDNSCF